MNKKSYRYVNRVQSKGIQKNHSNIIEANDIFIGKIPIGEHKSLRTQIFSKQKPNKYSYNYYQRYDSLAPSEYDLIQLFQAENIDGYFKRAVKIKTANMFKSGWRLTGKNPKTVQYIKKRFREIELASGYPMALLFRDLGRNFIRYSNAFLVKVRNARNSSGKRREITTRYGTKSLAPIAAYFMLPPESTHIRTDIDGNILKYVQMMPNIRKEFDPWNVVHFFYDRKAGYHMGTPVFWPAIDDLRALRRIEENVEYLVYYFVFPFFAVYVGTDNNPPAVFPDGTTEVDIVQKKISNMPTEGGLVLSYRHKIEPVSFKSSIDVSNYLEHFKKRAFSSLGVSSVDMGEGSTSNRNTADNLTRQMIDDVKDYQQVFQEFVDFEIITELLLESPWKWAALDEDNMVHFSFNEIDIDNRIKIENHNALMYQMEAITEDEMRMAINREPLTDAERKKLYLYLVQQPMAEMGSKTDATVNAAAKTKQQPTNQHGTKSGPEKAKSSLEGNGVYTKINTIIENYLEGDGLLTLDDLKKQILSIDKINQQTDVKQQVELVLDMAKSFFSHYDEKTAANMLYLFIKDAVQRSSNE